MIKQVNPFHTLDEAFHILKSLGVDPMKSNIAVSPRGNKPAVVWQEEILSVTTQVIYENSTHYYTVSIHLSNAGFEAVARLLHNTFPVQVVPHIADFDEHFIQPGTQLKLFTLVTRKEEETE